MVDIGCAEVVVIVGEDGEDGPGMAIRTEFQALGIRRWLDGGA